VGQFEFIEARCLQTERGSAGSEEHQN
jgi:hypothetical protein